MAITAWSAKVVTRSICLSVKGRASERLSVMTPSRLYSPKHWHTQHCPVGLHLPGLIGVLWILQDIRYVDSLPFERSSCGNTVTSRNDRIVLNELSYLHLRRYKQPR